MPREDYTFTFDYSDLQKLTGLSKNTLYQHRVRGNLNPEDLASVICFVALHGKAPLRRQILDYALARELPEEKPSTKRFGKGE